MSKNTRVIIRNVWRPKPIYDKSHFAQYSKI